MSTTRNSLPPLTESQKALAESYLPFCLSMARPFVLSNPSERNEYESAAQMGLVRAAVSYLPSTPVRFPTFARHYIRGHLVDAYQRLVRINQREVNLGDNAETWIEDDDTNTEDGELVSVFMDSLSNEDRKIFHELFILNLTIKQVSKRNRICKCTALKIKRRLLSRYKVRLRSCVT